MAKLGITEIRDTNQIANFALVEWADNIDISDDSPAEYIPKYEARFRPEELAQMRYWHALPEGWQRMDYRVFVEERRRRMAEVIRDAFALCRPDQRPHLSCRRSRCRVSRQPDDAREPDDADDDDVGLAPRHFMRRDFWQAFMQSATGRVPLPAKPGKGIYSWIYVRAPKKRLYWNYYIRMEDAGVDLQIYRHDEKENKRLFDQLVAHREDLEHKFGAALEWDRNGGGHGCTIRFKLTGRGLGAREDWPEIQERMIETILRFQKAFEPAIQELPD